MKVYKYSTLTKNIIQDVVKVIIIVTLPFEHLHIKVLTEALG